MYVDGFVIAVPKKNIAAYRRMSTKAGKIWKQYGALEYRECVGDDLKVGMGDRVPQARQGEEGETVVFSWIVYKSKAHRNAVNKKVMSDPRIQKMVTRAHSLRLEAHGIRRLQDDRRHVGGAVYLRAYRIVLSSRAS